MDDASTIIRRLARGIDQRVEADELMAETAKMVVCAMVRRAMSNPNIDPAITQTSTSNGPFSVSQSLGDRSLFLNRVERELLGIRKRAGAIDVLGKWAEPLDD